jgi:hypothetical protein
MPIESHRRLRRALDLLPASQIRGGRDREKTDPILKTSSLMLLDAISVVNHAAKKTARFGQDGHRPSRGETEPQKEQRVSADTGMSRRRH